MYLYPGNQHLRLQVENTADLIKFLGALVSDPKAIKSLIAKLEDARASAEAGLAAEEARLTTWAANLDALKTAHEKDRAFLAQKGKEHDKRDAALAEQEKSLAGISAVLTAREAKIKTQSAALDAERSAHSTDNAARAAQIAKRAQEIAVRENENVARTVALQEELKKLEAIAAALGTRESALKSVEAAAEAKCKEYEDKIANLRKHLLD